MWGDVWHAVANGGGNGRYFLCFQWVPCVGIRFRVNRVFVYYFLEKGYGSPMLVSRHFGASPGLFRVMMIFGSGDVRNRDASGLCRLSGIGKCR